MAGHRSMFLPAFGTLLLTVQTGAVDDVHRSVTDITDELKRAEGKLIVADLAKLKYELQHDRKLT
jgi:hypothetical protein